MTKELKEWNAEIKRDIPDMSATARMNLAVALKAEGEGNMEKANQYLDKAIDADV